MSDLANRMNDALIAMREQPHGSPLFWRAWMKLAALVDLAKKNRNGTAR